MASECDNMDVADLLLERILFWVEQQKKLSHKFNKMASELETGKKFCNVTKVVGSTVSVGGAVALTAAGVLGFFTGGVAAIPVLVATGSIATAAGITTNVTSDVIDIISSSYTMKEAENTAEMIESLERGIQKLMKTLKEEGERREQKAGSRGEAPPEDYVVERILRAMAKHHGLVLHEGISLLSTMSSLSKYALSRGDVGLDIVKSGVNILSKFVVKAVAKKSGKALIKELLPELVSTMGKTATKAAGRVAGGAAGLVFSVPELIINCRNLDDCKTEVSKSLSESAKAIESASEKLKKELDLIEKALERLAGVEKSIKNTKGRSSFEREILVKFGLANCKDKAIVEWLENTDSEVLFKLVDVFSLLKEKIDEEELKNHRNNVDITFVAHGSITDTMIPAGHLLPLPTVSDVVLYSPWNCNLSAIAAYQIATGRMKPKDIVFYCNKKKCKILDKDLPNCWNSLKNAGDQMIPNILLQPVGTPGDKAWETFEFLSNGKGKRNRIIVPFIIPGEKNDSSQCVPFLMVTLALSLVLLFSRFQATFHLTACLGGGSSLEVVKEHLMKQYAYTTDKTSMSCSALTCLALDVKLINMLKSVFG